MEHFFQPLINYLQTYPYLGQFYVFLIAFLESLPVIGTIMPGSITLTAIGILIGTGILPSYLTLASAAIGALFGDCIGFWIGYHFNQRILLIWPFNKYHQWLEASERFFAKHGGKSIVIGRFVGPVRSTVPLVAGLFNLSWTRFLVAAIPSAILWAIVYALPGILLGALSLEFPPAQMTKVLLIGLITIAIIWFIFWIIQFSFRRLIRIINHGIDQLWSWCNQHYGSRFMIKLITNQAQPSDHHQLTLLLLAVFCFLLWLMLFFQVIDHGFLTTLNEPLFYLAQSLRNNTANKLFVMITLLGTPELMSLIALIMIVGLAIFRQWRLCIHFVILVIITWAATTFGKTIYFSTRPTGFTQISSSSSFPSGHTIASLTILGFAAFITAQFCKTKFRWIPYTIASLLVLLISLSRMYLGAHWFSDIIGAWLLGFSILLLIICSYRRFPTSATHAGLPIKTWSFIAILSILLTWVSFTAITFHSTLKMYSPFWPEPKISIQDWWNNPTLHLPIYRQDRLGRPAQPFNLQWAGNFSQIEEFLLNHQWYPLTAKSQVKNTLEHFVSKAPEHHMSFLPWLYRQRPPDLLLVKQVPHQNALWAIRIWNSQISFTDSPLPLWVGVITYHPAAKKLLPLPSANYVHIQSSDDLKQLFNQLQSSWQAKVITVPMVEQPQRIRKLKWNGKIVLMKYTD